MSLHNFKFEAISADGRLHDTRVVRAMQTLQADPALSADDLASMLQLSTSRFQHLFKMQMGVSVTTYAREVRLHRASTYWKRRGYPSNKSETILEFPTHRTSHETSECASG